MKNISATLLLLIASLTAYAQRDCKITVETDEFTGAKTIATEMLRLTAAMSSSDWAKISIANIEGIDFIYLHAHTKSVSSVDKGAILYIKFTDGTVEQFENMFYTISEANYQVLTELSQGVVLSFPVSPEQLKKLASVTIEKSRIATSKRNLVFETPKKIAAALVECFSEYQSRIE